MLKSVNEAAKNKVSIVTTCVYMDNGNLCIRWDNCLGWDYCSVALDRW